MQIVNLTKSSVSPAFYFYNIIILFIERFCLSPAQNNIPIWMQVHVNETTNDVLSRALDQLAIAVSITELASDYKGLHINIDCIFYRLPKVTVRCG